MTRNKFTDLNNHLFAEIERLGDEELTGEALAVEITRAKAISGIATNLVNNAGVMLQATKLRIEYADLDPAIPKMLIDKTEER
ncbi:MAG: hypothetical protein LBK04_05065 [Clostridiales Family XIII bacterium]|jgi:hypothetical protein|nr:hypothetical protein [Clostridiales Family XIII bacterium]